MNSKRVYELRLQTGLTRAQLARALRLSDASGYEAVKDWETGARTISGPASVALEALASGFRAADLERGECVEIGA